jgi:hypothetical protein
MATVIYPQESNNRIEALLQRKAFRINQIQWRGILKGLGFTRTIETILIPPLDIYKINGSTDPDGADKSLLKQESA